MRWPLSGIQKVGSVHLGVSACMANCLQNNRQTKRASVGTINNLVQTPESADRLAQRETPGLAKGSPTLRHGL